MIKIFLDDYRQPVDCSNYMYKRIGASNTIYLEPGWIVVKNYDEFTKWITENGLPDLVSFDHDLADEHYEHTIASEEDWQEYHTYESREKTGYDCAKWLVDYCIEHKCNFPYSIVHSMNPVGTRNIVKLITDFNGQH